MKLEELIDKFQINKDNIHRILLEMNIPWDADYFKVYKHEKNKLIFTGNHKDNEKYDIDNVKCNIILYCNVLDYDLTDISTSIITYEDGEWISHKDKLEELEKKYGWDYYMKWQNKTCLQIEFIKDDYYSTYYNGEGHMIRAVPL